MRTDLDAAERACSAGRCEETIGLLEQAAPQRPGDLRLFYWLGVCYGGACRSHSLVHSGMAMAYLQQALRLAPGEDAPRAAVLDQLANSALHDGSVSREEALRAAIAFERKSAAIYDSLEIAEEWARTQFNLGNSFCELAEITRENHWLEAIEHFQSCLDVRRRELDPERHAAVLENLGTAYRQLRTVDGIKQALRCYRRALAIYTRAAYPERHAAIENNLGNAFLSLAEADESSGARHARRALQHFRRALGTEPDPRSRAFGIAQYNRAQAYFRLAREGAGNFGRAAACLKAAAAAFEACSEGRYLELIRRQLEGLKLPASPVLSSPPRAES